MIIIPAIDLIDGEVVRLHKGNYSEKKIYNVNPINLCNSWKDLGIKRIHIVDLQGALNGGFDIILDGACPRQFTDRLHCAAHPC